MARGLCAACKQLSQTITGPFRSGQNEVTRESLVSTITAPYRHGIVIENVTNDDDREHLVTSELMICHECLAALMKRVA